MSLCKNHDKCINDAFIQADLICVKHNLRFTDLRKNIFEIISKNHQPTKAYDILNELQKKDSSAKPSTVYRTLNFLLEYGLIHKLYISNTYINCAHPTKHHNCYFLICDKCNEIKECCDESLTKAVRNIATSNKFKIQESTIEINGLCNNCNSI